MASPTSIAMIYPPIILSGLATTELGTQKTRNVLKANVLASATQMIFPRAIVFNFIRVPSHRHKNHVIQALNKYMNPMSPSFTLLIFLLIFFQSFFT